MADFTKAKLRFGPFEADLQTQELWKNGAKLKLGGQPFEILAALLEKPGELVTLVCGYLRGLQSRPECGRQQVARDLKRFRRKTSLH